MFIYLVLANEDSPYLFGVYANEKEAVKEKNILKHANSDVKVKPIQCNTVPDYVYTVDLLYNEAGFDLREMLHLKFSEKKARGIFTHLYKSRYTDINSLQVCKHKVY